jgi:hypothetical protein
MANIPPYHVNVDLASALDTIAENNYVRDYDFHMGKQIRFCGNADPLIFFRSFSFVQQVE